MTRDDIIDLIIAERNRQAENPNTLSDMNKTKSDWTSLAGYYLFEGASRSDKHVSFEEFRESLIRTSAVLLAALESSYSNEDAKLQNLLHQLENKDDE